MSDEHRTVSIALTGASGAQYGLRLVQCVLEAGCTVYLMLSNAARVVINTETELTLPEEFDGQWQALVDYFGSDQKRLRMFSKEDWFSPVASGSSSPASFVICPASGGTMSAIAHGASNNLIERAADVALKERRQLILVPREMPLSDIHLENMLKLSRMGAVVMPASPGFYQQPKTVNDLVDFVVARILDQLGIDQKIFPKWGE